MDPPNLHRSKSRLTRPDRCHSHLFSSCRSSIGHRDREHHGATAMPRFKNTRTKLSAPWTNRVETDRSATHLFAVSDRKSRSPDSLIRAALSPHPGPPPAPGCPPQEGEDARSFPKSGRGGDTICLRPNFNLYNLTPTENSPFRVQDDEGGTPYSAATLEPRLQGVTHRRDVRRIESNRAVHSHGIHKEPRHWDGR